MKSFKKLSIVICFLTISVSLFAQTQGKVSPTVGANCTCGVNMSSCSATCLFTDCCVCWNPATQTGACGCFFGVSSCKNANNDGTPNTGSKGLTMDENSIFEPVHPDSKIVFHFNPFNKLVSFFKSKQINTASFESTNSSISGKYSIINDNAYLSVSDFEIILKEYAKLISQLDATGKLDLNHYINSLKQ
jgi:hypothetical protein